MGSFCGFWGSFYVAYGLIVPCFLWDYMSFPLSDTWKLAIMKGMESKQPVSGGQKAPDAEHTGVILATIGDTSWRMFVPTVGFTLLGVWLDGNLETTPWLMCGGIVIGFLGAFLLVKKQIDGLTQKKGRD